MKARAAFYGDDFTGSSDALAQFHRFGLRALLFFGVPPAALWARAAQAYDAIGIAGVARALPAAQIRAEIEPAFALFAHLQPRFVQYKVCSTCDSSERIGSFGPAIAAGIELLGARCIPFLPAQPEFGRYTAFANHFAAAGAGEVVRLDRHPTMAHHPSTPIDEADLRVFLRRQTDVPVVSLDLVELARTGGGAAALRRHCADGPRVVVVDALEQAALPSLGRMILEASPDAPAFALGSGGLSYAAAAALSGRAQPPAGHRPVAARERIVVLSGSASPRTREQIAHARERGWEMVALDARELLEDAAAATARAAHRLQAALARGGSAVVSSLREDHDRVDVPPERLAPLLGGALGALADHSIRAGVRRLVVAGGDTSSFAMRGMNAYGVEIAAGLEVAAWLCALRSDDAALDGTEIVLKGGQVGGIDFFERARMGTQAS